MKEKLIIYGTGRFAEYATYVFNHDSDYEVVGCCLESAYLKENKSNKKIIHKLENIEISYPIDKYYFFIAIGDNIARERIYRTVKEKGYKLATYISSKIISWDDLHVGENSFLGEGTVIQPYVKIGDNSIIFSSDIAHHCIIANHTLLSSCTLGGNVKIGEFSFLGLNSVIKENLTIKDRNIIGMGAVIQRDTEKNSIYTSSPAIKRKLTFEEYYSRD